MAAARAHVRIDLAMVRVGRDHPRVRRVEWEGMVMWRRSNPLLWNAQARTR